MPTDETPTPNPDEQTPEGTPGTTETPPAEPEEITAELLASLPEVVRKRLAIADAELPQARQEAANYRTKLREAETKLASAKTPEEFEAAVAELKTSNAALERQIVVGKVASKHDLPAPLAALLQGNTEEELDAHAKTLAELVSANSGTGSLSGGLTPNDDDAEIDMNPAALARRSKRR